MGSGIIVCGLNGSGKSTLGRALAQMCKFSFIDIEDLYFPLADSDYQYACTRTRDEVEEIFLDETRKHESFVFASVKGDFANVTYRYAVVIDVPKDIRMQRVRDRSFRRFGNRIFPGGDLYEREKSFFDFVETRSENIVDEWVQSLSCPVIRVDGTKPVVENAEFIIDRIRGDFPPFNSI